MSFSSDMLAKKNYWTWWFDFCYR